jgi:putative endonuclease
MRCYYVYMLQCFDGSFYVGVTNDVERRFWQHSSGVSEDCYTYSRRPLRLAYVGEFQWIAEAIAFEKRLKGWSHRKKRAFAEKAWPDLIRFSRTGKSP